MCKDWTPRNSFWQRPYAHIAYRPGQNRLTVAAGAVVPAQPLRRAAVQSPDLPVRSIRAGECGGSAVSADCTSAPLRIIAVCLTRSQFTGMLGVSAIFDIIWMGAHPSTVSRRPMLTRESARHEQNGFIKFLTVILLLLKVRRTSFFPKPAQIRQDSYFRCLCFGHAPARLRP